MAVLLLAIKYLDRFSVVAAFHVQQEKATAMAGCNEATGDDRCGILLALGV